jgi:hypothetical protein
MSAEMSTQEPNKEGTMYVGNYPRCRKRIEVKIGSGGTDSRFS